MTNDMYSTGQIIIVIEGAIKHSQAGATSGEGPSPLVNTNYANLRALTDEQWGLVYKDIDKVKTRNKLKLKRIIYVLL